MAGTGKIQKLISDVKELKESRSINTSLLALGRCVKLIAKGHTRQSIGSFRDSKLTRLFQHSLSGHENILLLISVNPSLELFVETQNVLNFASTAMKLTSEFTKEDKKVLDYRTPISSSKAHEIHSPTLRKVFSEQEIADIKLTNKQLLAEIKELKSKNLKDEYEIRQELADFYLKQFSSLEENWKSRMLAVEEEKTNLLRISIREVENNYKEKLEKLTDRKRKRIDRGDFEECTDAEVLDDTRNVHYSSIMLPLTQNSEQSVKRDSKILNQKKNRYSSELLLLRKSLKTLVESIKNPDKQSVNVTYFKGLSTKIFDTKNPFDKEAISDLTTIAEFIMKPYELANKRENLKQVEPASSTKGIQCNMECTMLSQFCKEIRELLDPNFVKLPDIDNDLNLSEYAQDEDNYDQLITLLHQVKELIMEKVSKIIEFEVENIEKSDQFKALKAKIEEQERDILQSRIQQQESESSRLALLERIEDFESKAKSKEFFKDFDFETENLKATSIDETHYELNITDKLSIPETSYDNNCSLCLCESDSDKNDSGAGRLTSDSSKNDSGLASSVEYPIGNAKDEMYQTNVFNEENKVILNIDYECRKTQPLEDSLRLTELSQELEEMKAEMTRLKENYFAKELIIHEYQRKFSADKIEIERLNSEKQQLEIKCDESMKNERDNSKEYEEKLAELQVKLKVHEDGENGEARCLEHYWGESVNLGSQLSSIYSQLEKSSTACKEYMIKINQLEKEFNVTRINENKVLELLIEYKSDHAIMSKLSEKVNDFENTLTRMEKEKADLQELLCEKSKSASEVEEQSTDIIKKFEECDKQVLSLKSEISVITRTNLTNRRKATELGDEVAKLMQKISKMEENLKNAEAIRKDLEQSSNKEIGNLRSRLIIFEENAKLLNIIRDGNENKPSYVDKLQRKLLEKEKELEFFRKNRSATIQRYECLVGHLQDALKMNDNLNKTKGTFPPKQNYFFSDYEESLSWDIHDSTSQARRPTSLYDTDRLSSSNVQDIMYFTYAENAETTISKEDADHLV